MIKNIAVFFSAINAMILENIHNNIFWYVMMNTVMKASLYTNSVFIESSGKKGEGDEKLVLCEEMSNLSSKFKAQFRY